MQWETPDESELQQYWKVSPSSHEGYTRNYSLETADGDLLEVDYHYSREMVRIALTLDRENGRQYVAVIKSGMLLHEREFSSKRPVDLRSRLTPFRKYFSHFPDNAVLKSIGGNYDFPAESAVAQKTRRISDIFQFQDLKPMERLRRHLEKKKKTELAKTPIRRFLHRLKTEALDLSLGLLLLSGFFYGFLRPSELALLAGFSGVFLGAWDWVWRQRDPFIPKVLIFLMLGAWAVYYEIQHRVWGIFL